MLSFTPQSLQIIQLTFYADFGQIVKTHQKILKAKSKAIIEIKKAFDKGGIKIPFPIRTLEFSNKLDIQNQLAKSKNSQNQE